MKKLTLDIVKIDELGEFYDALKFPDSLVLCERENLFKFPDWQGVFDNTLSCLPAVCSEQETMEAQIKLTIGVGSKKQKFNCGLDRYLDEAEVRSDFFGLSIQSIYDLAAILDCENPLIDKNKARVHIEQIFFLSKQLVTKLLAIDVCNIEPLCEAWQQKLLQTYSTEPIVEFSRFFNRYYYSSVTEYDISHINVPFLVDFLSAVIDICQGKDRGQVVFLCASL